MHLPALRSPALRPLVRALVADLRSHDVVLYAAAMSFYGAIAAVPTLLLALWASAQLVGGDVVVSLAAGVADTLPDELGAPTAVRRLAAAAVAMSPLMALASLLPAMLYGEGLRRAFDRLADTDERMTGWRGRLLVLPALAVAPLFLLPVLLVGARLETLLAAGTGRTMLGIYLAFLLDWLLVSVLLVWAYRHVAPHRTTGPSRRAVLWSAFGAGSFVAGFLQGFVLFLALPIDLGAPFGGFDAIGGAVALGLWLFVLHLIVLVGYAAALRLDAVTRRTGRRRERTAGLGW